MASLRPYAWLASTISSIDESFNASLTLNLKKRCQDLELNYIFKDEFLLSEGKKIKELGSTELGRLIQFTQGAWSGATIQIPTLHYHTSSETTSFIAIENYYKLLKNILIENPIEFSITVEKSKKTFRKRLFRLPFSFAGVF